MDYKPEYIKYHTPTHCTICSNSKKYYTYP